MPPTVDRVINGRNGSVQLFMDSVDINTAQIKELQKQRFFDFIIFNRDRHNANYLAGVNGNVISIDHGSSLVGRSSTIALDGPYQTEFLHSIEGRQIIEKFKQTDLEAFEKEIADYLGPEDAEQLIWRIEQAIERSN